MPLDARGKISIAEIVFYVPVLCFAFFLTFRHGFKRDAGWIFLLIFAVVRIVGGAVHIAAEQQSPPGIGIFITAFTLEAAGLSPLMLCTTAFLAVVAWHTAFPFASKHIFRLVRLAIVVAFALAIAGGSEAASDDGSTRASGTTLRKVASIMLVGCYAIITAIHFLLWLNKDLILRHRRTLLIGISAALPFLAVRVVYAVLSAFSPTPTFGQNGVIPSSSGLSKFNTITGSWQIFLVMSLVMEFVVVVIYITVGTVIPLQEDDQYQGTEGKSDDAQVYDQQYGGRV